MRAFWTSAFFVLLGFTACTSNMDVTLDDIESANQKVVSTASKTGFSLIEVPEGISTREVAQQLRVHGIRPLVITPDSQIIIEALNVDPAILPPETQIAPLESPYPDLIDSGDGGEEEEPLLGESSQSVAHHLVTDAIVPSENDLEKRGEGTWGCSNPPYCFPSLTETVGVQVFFPESKEGVAGEHEDWEPGEIEQAMKVFRFELASLARVAPPEARLAFFVTNLGALEVSGEPTSGYGPDNVLNELLPKLRELNQISLQGSEFGGIYDLYRTVVSELIDRDQLTTVTFMGIARDKAAPFATRVHPTNPSAPFYWNWWPSALLGAPYARSTWSDHSEDGSVFIHELLHTFGALDQYRPYISGQSSNDCLYLNSRNGYYGPMYSRMLASGAPFSASGAIIVNGNALNCLDSEVAAEKLPDIMISRDAFVSLPWSRPLLSWFTRAQIGWGSSKAVSIRHSGFSRSTRELNPAPEVKINGFRYLSLPLAGGEYRIGETFVYGASTETRFAFQNEINGVENGVSTTYQRVDCQKDTLDVIGYPADNNGDFGNDGRVQHIQRIYEPKVPHQAIACPVEPTRQGTKEQEE